MVVSSTLIVLPADTQTPAPPAPALGLEETTQGHQGDPEFFTKPAGSKEQKATALSVKTKG